MNDVNKKVSKEVLAKSVELIMDYLGSEFKEEILSNIPNSLPNPQPIAFGGMIPHISYDGSKSEVVYFPNMETTSKSSGTPVGEIIPFMGNIAPTNYLICDGTVYNIDDYPELVQHFIDEFGSSNYFGGDGVTTFAVPDLKGEFLRGSGQNSHVGNGDGSDVGVHQNATQQNYIGKGTAATSFSTYGIASDDNYGNFDRDNMDTVVTSNQRFYNNNPSTVTEEGVGYYTSRPTNTSVLWCIKYRQTFFVVTPEVIYSLDERRVGTWIDGKPLYERAFNLDKQTYTDPSKVTIIDNICYFKHNLPDIDSIFIDKSLVFPNDETIISEDIGRKFGALDAGSFGIRISSTEKCLYWWLDNAVSVEIKNLLFIVRYTKTTDSISGGDE